MTWDECLTALESRTGMYVPFPYYPSSVSLLIGFDLAHNQGVIRGFQEWMAERHGGSNLVFEALALREYTGRDTADEFARSREVASEEQVRAVRHLCGLLREFLALSG